MPCQVFFLPGGGAEHDPAEWWSAIKACIKQVLHDSGVATKNIIAVAVTSMWGVTVAVDERGEPLMRAMSWMDVRGAKYNRELVRGFPMVEGYQLGLLLKYLDKHGFPPSPTDPIGHMLWIKNERPEIYKRTYKFLEPVDYINMKLTGRFTATQNTVLPMLICDNRRLDRTEYDPWLVKTCTIDPAKFPELLPIDGIIGPITDGGRERAGAGTGHHGCVRFERQQHVRRWRGLHRRCRARRVHGQFRAHGFPYEIQEVRHGAHHVRHPQRHQGHIPVLGRPGKQLQGAGHLPEDALVRAGYVGHGPGAARYLRARRPNRRSRSTRKRRRALPAMVQRQHFAGPGRIPARRLHQPLAQHGPLSPGALGVRGSGDELALDARAG